MKDDFLMRKYFGTPRDLCQLEEMADDRQMRPRIDETNAKMWFINVIAWCDRKEENIHVIFREG